MKLRFTTGELARLHGVSKQTLIFYDKAGVFCPREKDPITVTGIIRKISWNCWIIS